MLLLMFLTALLSFLPDYIHVPLSLKTEQKQISFHYMRLFEANREGEYDQVLFLNEKKRPIFNWYDFDLKLEVVDEDENRAVRLFYYGREEKRIEVLRAECYRSVQTQEQEYELYRVTYVGPAIEVSGDGSADRLILIVEYCSCRRGSIDVWIAAPCSEVRYWPLIPVSGAVGFISHYLFEEGQEPVSVVSPYDETEFGGEGSGAVWPEEGLPGTVPEPPTFLLLSVAAVLIVLVNRKRGLFSQKE